MEKAASDNFEAGEREFEGTSNTFHPSPESIPRPQQHQISPTKFGIVVRVVLNGDRLRTLIF
jgi:hypothetical protein